MGAPRLCWLSLLAAIAVTAGDLNILTGIRSNTPWSHFIIEASKAAEDGQYAVAAAAYESATRAIPGTSREDRLELAVAFNGLGACYGRLGRQLEAELLFKRAIGMWRDILGPHDIMVAVALNNLAEVYTTMGRHEQARRCQAEALKIDETAFGPAAPLVANDLNNLGVTYAHQHKFSDAERHFRNAIAIGSSSTTPHPRLSEFTGNLASLLAVLNDADEAEQMHESVLAMQVKERGSTHASVGLTLVHLADCEIRLKRYAAAVGHAGEAAGILRARLGEHNPRTGSAYFALARAYDKLKRSDLAEPAIQLVMEIDKDAVIDPSDRSAHLREYATVLRGIGKKDEAKAAEKMAAQVDQQDVDEALSRETVDVKALGTRFR